jgi:PIN like domain
VKNRSLEFLSEQAGHIFVTQRVVEEVKRQKIKVVAGFFGSQITELKAELKTQRSAVNHAVPDHLFGTTEAQTKSIRNKMAEIKRMITEVTDEVKNLTGNIVEKVSQSTDEVSVTLAPIFANAISHSEPEMQRAKARKERGDPPGKPSNPLGDELNWEQILARFAGRTKLWIITKDSDYGTVYNNRGFLNRCLYEELRSISSNAEVFLFDDIPNGIKHYVSVTGVTAHKIPTTAQIDEFKSAEERLPPLDWLTTNDNSAAIAAVQEAVKFQKAAIAAFRDEFMGSSTFSADGTVETAQPETDTTPRSD